MAKVRIPFDVGNQVWSFWMEDHDAKDFIVGLITRDRLDGYEKPIPRVVAGVALSLGGNFLDIGANTGVYSLLYSSLAVNANAYAFEPLVCVARAFEINVGLNPHLAQRVHLERYALSNRAGYVTWYETINDQGLFSTSSSLLEARAKSIGRYTTAKIKTRTLDEFALERDLQFCLAKIDVEGHERAVLDGAQQTIEKNRPVLIIEVLRDADYQSLNSWISTMGYVTHAACGSLLLRLDCVEYVAAAQNHVLCPREHLHRMNSIAERVGLLLA
jgi:FkbM family methyltransferase